MRRSRFSFLQFSLLLALAAVFLYSASVQEIHYLFINHHAEVNEHCDHHLHAQSNHVECNLCKIDLGSYVQSYVQFEGNAQVFTNDLKLYSLLDVRLNFYHAATAPRGPPAIA